MKISEIRINNFRSIQKANIACSNLVIFIGQNNAGKTNLFEAVEWFFNGTSRDVHLRDLIFRRDDRLEMSVEIVFTGALDGASKMQNSSNRTKIIDLLGSHDNVSVKRTSTNDKKRIISINGNEIAKLPTGFDAALNDFLPRFEYISTKQYYDAVATYSKKTPIGIMLSGVLTTILEKSQRYKDFIDRFTDLFQSDKSEVKVEFDKLGGKVKLYLQKQFPDCSKVLFEVQPPIFDDLLKNFDTSINDGIETTAEEKGDGMQRALMLAIIQAYSDFRKENEDVGKSFLFFIDEAELHLHPTAQRKLKNVLLELSENTDQVFINTHSSVFVADDHQRQCICMAEKEDGITTFTSVGENEKPYIVYDLLGGSPSDLLLPRNFLIVEGPTEVHFFTRIISRFYPDKPRIQIIPADGDISQTHRTINSIRKTYAPLGRSLYASRSIILCDRPKPEAEAGFNVFTNQNQELLDNGQLHVLPHCSIEECYPNRNGWQRTPDQVSRMSGQDKIKLAKRVGNEITQTEFEQDMQIFFTALNSTWNKSF